MEHILFFFKINILIRKEIHLFYFLNWPSLPHHVKGNLNLRIVKICCFRLSPILHKNQPVRSPKSFPQDIVLDHAQNNYAAPFNKHLRLENGTQLWMCRLFRLFELNFKCFHCNGNTIFRVNISQLYDLPYHNLFVLPRLQQTKNSSFVIFQKQIFAILLNTHTDRWSTLTSCWKYSIIGVSRESLRWLNYHTMSIFSCAWELVNLTQNKGSFLQDPSCFS